MTIIYYRKRWDTISATPLQLDVEVQEFVKVEIREKSLVSIHLEQNSLSQHALTYQIVSLGDLTLLSGTANEEGCFGMHCVSLLDKPFLELPPQQYLIRLKKKSIDGARPKQPTR